MEGVDGEMEGRERENRKGRDMEEERERDER